MKNLLIVAAASVLAAGTATAGEVSVTVSGLESTEGNLLVALQSEEQFLKKESSYALAVPVAGTEAVVTMPDVAAGSYAVAVVHDVDGNGDFTVEDNGPTEPWGLSGGEGEMTGAPEFPAHSIEVEEDGMAEASVTLMQ